MVGGILGAIAQLGERLLCKQEVTGSIPVGSTSALEEIRREAKSGPVFWLLLEVQNRLIFNNSGKMKVSLWRGVPVVWALLCARTWVNVLHRVTAY